MKEHKIYAQGISDFERKFNEFFTKNPSAEIKSINPLKSKFEKSNKIVKHHKFVVSILYE